MLYYMIWLHVIYLSDPAPGCYDSTLRTYDSLSPQSKLQAWTKTLTSAIIFQCYS